MLIDQPKTLLNVFMVLCFLLAQMILFVVGGKAYVFMFFDAALRSYMADVVH